MRDRTRSGASAGVVSSNCFFVNAEYSGAGKLCQSNCRTSGFEKDDSDICLDLHRPHPKNILKLHQMTHPLYACIRIFQKKKLPFCLSVRKNPLYLPPILKHKDGNIIGKYLLVVALAVETLRVACRISFIL
jgi:hypothetical protein